ncbi:hypothetical protein GP486_003711 [Trichoglossum hirsutum]|uniref:Nucleolar protein Dnt1-like N-terminal domain-containing protein n=1 Tax=Trichoglossum hirsutum TaxID=265104 RepID=A0A9P8LCE8_9PEZI|nr:hypothetical protein GP486_003711 [Trichoglossum hirsutum]
MRLQVQVLPLNDRRFAGKASSPSITQSQQHPSLPQGALSFLEVCDDGITLEELCSKLCVRFARIYPHKPPLNIKKLQDVYENDLDLEYTVGDVFDDKSADQRNSVVRVLQAPTTRDSSVPPQSSLRPHIHGFISRKRAFGGLDALRERVTVGGDEAKAERASKRRRFRDLMRDSEEEGEVDPDQPIPSQEVKSDDASKPMQYTGNEWRAGREAPPGRVIDTAGVNPHPSGKSTNQIPSETLTVPESPTQQGRIRPVHNQPIQREGLAGDLRDGSPKSESDNENSGLLHSIPRSPVGSPFLEGEGIIKEKLATTSHGPAPLSTPKAQKLHGGKISGPTQSIATPSSIPKPPVTLAAQSPGKLKRPNPSMFKSSSRSTGSTEESSNIYDAIDTDDDAPSPSSLGPELAKRVKRHNSFTAIMNGQSPLSNTLGSGKPNRSPGSEGATAMRRGRRAISPLEIKLLHHHEKLQSRNRDDKRDSEDHGSSSHVLTRDSREGKVMEKQTKEQIWREGRIKAMEEQGRRAMVEAEKEKLQRETEKNMQERTERVRQQQQLTEAKEGRHRASKRAAQKVEESRHKEEDKSSRRHQKEVNDGKRREEEKQRAKEVEDKKEAARLEKMKKEKEKRLENERRDQERKERAQRLAQTKALKTEKAEKEAEAKRLTKKNEETAAREAAERVEMARKEANAKGVPKKNQEKAIREAAEKVEKAERGAEAKEIAKNKGPAKETAGKKPPEEGTRRKPQDAKQARRLSTTPFIPRAASPKNALANGYGSSSVPIVPVRDVGPDPQIPSSLEQGAPRQRSVSFIVDETQHTPNLSSSSNLADLKPAPAPPQVPRKVTKVYPPGMGPDSLRSFTSVSSENPIVVTPKPKVEPPASSAQAPNTQVQPSSNLEQVSSRKGTIGGSRGSIQKPSPKPPSTREEIVKSPEDSDSNSHHSDTSSDSENTTTTNTAKPATANASAHSISTAKSDDKESVSSSVSSATSSRPRSRSHSKPSPRDPPRAPSPTQSLVGRISRSSHESSSSSSTSASRSPRSKSLSTSRSESSSLKPSRSQSDSTEEVTSDDEDTEDDVSTTSSESSSRSSVHASKKLNDHRDETTANVSPGSNEAANRLNGVLQQSAQHSTEARGKKHSKIVSPVPGSSQAKPSLDSFPSLSQLGSQSFDQGAKNRENKTGPQKSHPRVAIKSTSLASPEESCSSSDESSSDDDSGDDNGLPQNRRAGDAEPNSKVARGFKGLITGMWNWRSSQGGTN